MGVPIKTHFRDEVLDIFVGQLRYVLMRETRQEFWVRVFDSWKMKESEDIKRFKQQADILFDAFSWAKIVMLMMDGKPAVSPIRASLNKAELSTLTQRLEFINYAKSDELAHLWGLTLPPEAPEALRQVDRIAILRQAGQESPQSQGGRSVALVVPATPLPVHASRQSSSADNAANAADAEDGVQQERDGESKRQDQGSRADSGGSGHQDGTSSSRGRNEESAALGGAQRAALGPEGRTDLLSPGPSPSQEYKSSYSFQPSQSLVNTAELVIFAAAQRKEPFSHGDERSLPNRRSVAPFSPVKYRDEITYISGATSAVKLHHIIGPTGLPLAHLPNQDTMIRSIGYHTAVYTDRKRPGKDQSIPSDDIRRLVFDESFKLAMLKKSLLPVYRKILFPKGFKPWHPPSLDAAWSILFDVEKRLKDKQAIQASLSTSGPKNKQNKATRTGTTNPVTATSSSGSTVGGTALPTTMKTKKEKGKGKGKSSKALENPVSASGKPVCRQYLQGNCKRNPCRFAHEPAVNPSEIKTTSESSSSSTMVAQTHAGLPGTMLATATVPRLEQNVFDWSAYRITSNDQAMRGYYTPILLRDTGKSNVSIYKSEVRASKVPVPLDKEQAMAALKANPVETILKFDNLCRGNIREAFLRTAITAERTFRVVIDTGADASMVSKNLYQQVLHVLPAMPSEVALVGAMTDVSTPITVRICVPLVISIAPLAVAEHWFLVVPGLAVDFMLGMDFFTRFQCQLKCDGPEVTLIVGAGKAKYPISTHRVGEDNGKKTMAAFLKRKADNDLLEEAMDPIDGEPSEERSHLILQMAAAPNEQEAVEEKNEPIVVNTNLDQLREGQTSTPTTVAQSQVVQLASIQDNSDTAVESKQISEIHQTTIRNRRQTNDTSTSSSPFSPQWDTPTRSAMLDLSERTERKQHNTYHPNVEQVAQMFAGFILPTPVARSQTLRRREAHDPIRIGETLTNPRMGLLIRNLQSAPTQRQFEYYLQNYNLALTRSDAAIVEEVLEPIEPATLMDQEGKVLLTTAVENYQAQQFVEGHLPYASFLHTPLIQAIPSEHGRAGAMFEIEVPSNEELDSRIERLKEVLEQRIRLLDPVVAYPTNGSCTMSRALEGVQGGGAQVALLDIKLIDDNGQAVADIPWSADLVWESTPVLPNPVPLDFERKLWENGVELEQILKPQSTIQPFSFNAVPNTFDYDGMRLHSDSWRYIVVWARLFEMFTIFAEEPYKTPLAFFWQITACRKNNVLRVVKYALGVEDHTPITMALLNALLIQRYITPRYRERAIRAFLLPPLYRELQQRISIELRIQPNLIPLQRHGPHTRILPLAPGQERVYEFNEDSERVLTANRFYTISWLPFAHMIFGQVRIENCFVYVNHEQPAVVRIRLKNLMNVPVIFPFRIALLGAKPLQGSPGPLEEIKEEKQPPNDEDDDESKEQKEPWRRRYRTMDLLPSQAIIPLTSFDAQFLMRYYVSRPLYVVKVIARAFGLWPGDETPSNIDDDSVIYASLPDLRPLRSEELLEQLQFNQMSFSSAQHKQAAKVLLLEFADCFVLGGSPPLSKLPAHRIDTGAHAPIYQHLRRFSSEKDKVLKDMVTELMSHGIVRPSYSAWASPPHLVRNKDGSMRLTIDYKRLNEVTTKDRFPLPRVADVIDSLAGKSIFSIMDLSKGYWAVPIAEEDIGKTAFLTRDGLYEWVRMPFGLCNAPATFQRCINTVFAGLLWITLTVYIDDIAVGSQDFMSHLRTLREVFQRLRTWGLRMKAQKCKFFQQEVEILGFRISTLGKKPTDRLIKAVMDFPVPLPKNGVKTIQSFLGLINYYACFIPHLAKIAHPLRRLTRDNVPWEWGVKQEEAFRALKLAITSAPLLRLPDPTKQFILYTDACIYGLGAVLHQVFEDGEHPIGYASRTISKAEAKWPIRDLEALAILWAYEFFNVYLEGSKVLIYTDHQSLKWLFEPTASSRIQRWALKFMEIRHLVEIQYKPGINNTVADALSRSPVSELLTQVNKLTLKDKEPRKDDKKTQREVPTAFYCLLSKKLPSATLIKSKQCLLNLLFVRIIPISNQLLPIPDTPEFEHLAAAQDMFQEYKRIRDALNEQSQRPLPQFLQYAWDKFLLIDNILCLKDKSGKGNHRMCIPPSLRAEILYLFHDSPMASHVGRDKMLSLLGQRFYWEGWQKDVAQWIRECPLCQVGKATKTGKVGHLQPKDIRFPWEMVSIDIMGPMPPSKNKQYILTMVDCFTRFCILVPLKSRTATVVADAMFVHLVCTFSVPRAILTDQGPEFESGLFKHLCERMGLKKVRTSTYHPQTNGTAERLHRFIKYSLRTVCDEHPRMWAQLLPHIAFAYNTTPVSKIGFTPFELVFGRPPTLPVDLLVSNPALFEDDQYRFNLFLTKRLRDMYDLVRKNQTDRNAKMKARYDASHRPISYQVGDYALLYRPADEDESITKLHTPFKGPYEVIKKLDEQLYELQDITDEEVVVRAHVQNMRPYFPRILYQDFSSEDDEDYRSHQGPLLDEDEDKGVTDELLREQQTSSAEEKKINPDSIQPLQSTAESKDQMSSSSRDLSAIRDSYQPEATVNDPVVVSDSESSSEPTRRVQPSRSVKSKPAPLRERRSRKRRERVVIEPEEEVTAFTELRGLPIVPFFTEEYLLKFAVVQDSQGEDRRPYVGQFTSVNPNKRSATVWVYGPRQQWAGGVKNIFKWVWYPAYVDLKDNKAIFSIKHLLGRRKPWYFEVTAKDVVSEVFSLTVQYKIPRGTLIEARSYTNPPRLEQE